MTTDIERISLLSAEIDAPITTKVKPAINEEFNELPPKISRGAGEEIFRTFVTKDVNDGTECLAIVDKSNTVLRLYLNGTAISEIPDTVFKLESLELLCIYANLDLHSIPPAIRSLHHLEFLYIGSNHELREIPKELARLPRLRWVSVVHCPSLTNPPREIAEQGIDAIRNYFDSVDETKDIHYLYEAKLVLVGRGFAGKTSLVRKLTIMDYNLEGEIKSTEGIAIDIWDLKMSLEKSEKFRFNIWDFVGQEKYDATHQFFITERTVYLFVTEARQESNYLDFDYWLNVVQMLGDNSPVIVVQNKIDLRKKSLPTAKYRSQFPNIVDFVDVSCADGYEETISNLVEVMRRAVRRLPQVGDALPGEWVTIRNSLKDLGVDYISYDDYHEICHEHGLSTERADFLSRYFHDLGVIVHHQQDPLLKKLVILNPDWAVDAVYNVLDTRSIEERDGRFDSRDLEKIWRDEKYADMQAELLALMQNYQLCFELPGTGTYIAPELLAANPVKYKPIKKTSRLTFIYLYAFMPAGLITRLIVKLHHHIDGQRFWRHGVVVKYGGARAVVVEDDAVRQVRIDIEGTGRPKRDLLAIIRKEFSDIYADFNRRIEYDELIPCNCERCLARIEDGEEPHFYDWRTVQRYAEKKIPTIRCGGESLAEVSVANLMGEIADKPDAWGVFGLPASQQPDKSPRQPSQPELHLTRPPLWERVTVVAFGVGFVLMLLAIALLVPDPTNFQIWVFRVVLALAAGGRGCAHSRLH